MNRKTNVECKITKETPILQNGAHISTTVTACNFNYFVSEESEKGQKEKFITEAIVNNL
jgi:hypothetical protein